ncbi:MAG: peptide deformylase [Clostridiales Family XIII bacterium]|jgi:peptide deformylase|nr:peptide deformylase [Clostridiales Family XIII bacterium]
MALRTIVLKNDPILRKKSRAVVDFDARLHVLLDDMWETLRKANGLGLAAPQVGTLRRVVIIDVGPEPAEAKTRPMHADHEKACYEIINPEILETRGEIESQEGCLSIPGYSGMVKRPAWVKISAQDRNGTPFLLEGEGMLAKAIFHETDHLDGILYTDLATDLEKVE